MIIDVSIIIPVYNTEKFLRICVDSVINQSVQPLEILLIDDGSIDKSSQICDEYSNLYNNIFVYHKNNEGLGITRNFGIQHSNGEYIMFLDSDDYLKYDMLEVLYKATHDKEFDIVKSGYNRTNVEGKVIGTKTYTSKIIYRNDEIKQFMIPKSLGSLPEKHDSIEMGVTCSLIRRSIVINNHIVFPSEREWISEDLIFNLEFLPRIQNAVLIPYEGYFYRTNPNSLTVAFKENRFSEICKLYKQVVEMIKKIELTDEAELRWNKTFIIYIWMCVLQEKKKSFRDSRLRIKKICEDAVIRNVIFDYPVKKLGIKQRIFIWLLMHKMSSILWGIAQCM